MDQAEWEKILAYVDCQIHEKINLCSLAGKPVTNAEYSQMGDLVRAGMQTVNSLCESLQVTVYWDGRSFRQDFVRGIAQHEVSINR